MTKTYEKWSVGNTELLNTIIDPDATKLAKMAGTYLSVVTPVLDKATQKLGAMTFTAAERSWGVVSKTQEEKDEYAAAQAGIAQAAADAQEIVDEIAASPLDGLTFTEAAEYIDNTVTDLPSAKVALKKLAKAILILNKRLGL